MRESDSVEDNDLTSWKHRQDVSTGERTHPLVSSQDFLKQWDTRRLQEIIRYATTTAFALPLVLLNLVMNAH